MCHAFRKANIRVNIDLLVTSNPVYKRVSARCNIYTIFALSLLWDLCAYLLQPSPITSFRLPVFEVNVQQTSCVGYTDGQCRFIS